MLPSPVSTIGDDMRAAGNKIHCISIKYNGMMLVSAIKISFAPYGLRVGLSALEAAALCTCAQPRLEATNEYTKRLLLDPWSAVVGRARNVLVADCPVPD